MMTTTIGEAMPPSEPPAAQIAPVGPQESAPQIRATPPKTKLHRHHLAVIEAGRRAGYLYTLDEVAKVTAEITKANRKAVKAQAAEKAEAKRVTMYFNIGDDTEEPDEKIKNKSKI